MVVVLAVVNIRGVKESTGVNVFFAVADFLTQVVLVIVGLVLVFSPEMLVDNVDLGVTPTWREFLVAIPVAMLAYTGIETVSNLAEEARDYGTTIPRGIGGVVGAVAVIYAFLPAVALSAMPVVNGETTLALSKEEGGYADDPVLGVVANMDLGALQGAAEIYVGVLAATILFIATNAGMIGVSRLTYSMGQYRQLPERLRQLHPRYRTPYVAILVFGAIACLTIVPGQAEFLGKIYAFGAMLSFTIAHVAVCALRVSRPTSERPYRIPGNVRMRGHALPLPSVIGGLSTGGAFVVLSVLNVEVLISGVVWLAMGVGGYVIYRRQPGPEPDPDEPRWCAPSRSWSTRWSTSRCWWPSRTAPTRRRPSPPPRSWRRGAGAGSTCWSRSPCRRARRSTLSCRRRRPRPRRPSTRRACAAGAG